jgi:hypothetical protein
MTMPSLYTIYKAWKIRYLDPLYFTNPHVMRCINDHPIPKTSQEPRRNHYGENSHTGTKDNYEYKRYWRPICYASKYVCDEIKYMIKAICEDPKAFFIFKKYHNHAVRDRYKQETKVKMEDIPDDVFLFLQDKVVKEMNKRNILAEVMLTSNVRISFYKEYGDHHVLRWLDPKSSRPQPLLTLATDDAGIFATNLRNEYSHLIQMLCDKMGVERFTAYDIAQSLMRKAEAFRFDRHHDQSADNL